MYWQVLAFWCYALLLVVSSSQPQKNSTNDDKRNSMVQYELDANLKDRSDEAKLIWYNTRENATKDNEMQHEFRANSMGKNRENNTMEYEILLHSTKNHQGGNQMLMELRTDYTKANIKNDSTSHEFQRKLMKLEEGKNDSVSHKPYENFMQNITNNFTLHEFHGNFSKDNNESNTFTYEVCNNNTCIQLCCPLGDRLINEKCVSEKGNYSFPVYTTSDSQNKGRKLNEVFQLIINDPCEYGRYVLNPEDYPEDEYMVFANGSLYQPHYDEFIELTSYCLAVVNGDQYEVAICFSNETKNATLPDQQRNDIPVVGLIISLPFLLVTFVVYSILPELRNMHGYTLREYVGSLFVAYTVLAVIQLINQAILPDFLCIAMAFIIHFSFLASFFWLNVMCFDIWWTFGGFRSLQGSVKQRERKKFIIYSIYAWGSASILTIICAIMDFVPNVPKHLIRPEFGTESCWFTTDAAKALYFYGPMGITIVCNICLFISTALKIVRHKKDTAHHLRGSESRRHDDNKQWFSLYLKLFIVMGINWSMEIVSWLIKSAPQYVWYLTDLTNTLQGLIIFIIFVWKEKIKRLLLKRFGCQDRDFFSRNSTRSGIHSTTSRTCTTSTGVMPLQVKISPYVQANCRTKSSSDEADP